MTDTVGGYDPDTAPRSPPPFIALEPGQWVEYPTKPEAREWLQRRLARRYHHRYGPSACRTQQTVKGVIVRRLK